MKHTSETFLSVPGYEGLYEVSNKGNVKSLRRGKLMKKFISNVGYEIISLIKDGKQKTFYVHRLVALVFIPNPLNLPEINHKDEIKINNCVDNLEWCDRKYNLNYGNYGSNLSKTLLEVGINRKPVACYNKKTGELIKTYSSITEAEKELGLSRGAIGKALSGRRKTAGGFVWKYNKHYTMADLDDTSTSIDLTPSAETTFFEERSRWFEENAIEVVNF